MKILSVLAVPLVISFNFAAHAGVGDALSNTCRVTSVSQQARSADSEIPEISQSYMVALAHLECTHKMILTGGIEIQNFDSAFSASDTAWLQNVQASGTMAPAVFVDNAYSVSVRSFAGRSNFVSADKAREYQSSHRITVQTTESVYGVINATLDQQSIARDPFTLQHKTRDGAIQEIPSWSREFRFISQDKATGIVFSEYGPTNSKTGIVRAPQADFTLAMRLTPTEESAGGTNHSLSEADSDSLRAIFGGYFKINDKTTGSRINDRDITLDCRARNCVITLEAFRPY